MPSLSDSSLKSEIPIIFLSLTRSAISSISSALLTMNGISLTMICDLFFSCSIVVFALKRIFPRPVWYASLIPALPQINAPVGKSGPWIICIISSIVISGLSTCFMTASHTSIRLCGGIFVAIPTAIPELPFKRRFGSFDGSTEGS